jgi:hypothetical protein
MTRKPVPVKRKDLFPGEKPQKVVIEAFKELHSTVLPGQMGAISCWLSWDYGLVPMK